MFLNLLQYFVLDFYVSNHEVCNTEERFDLHILYSWGGEVNLGCLLLFENAR